MDEATEKPCKACKKTLPLTDFYKHPFGVHGRLHNCKECHKAKVKANRTKKIEFYRAYDCERFQRADRKEQVQRSAKKRQQRFPEKRRATTIVRRAVLAGCLVPKPCRDCGCCDVQGHHPDYSKPLDVTWLCFPCHRREHGQEGVKPNPRVKTYKAAP